MHVRNTINAGLAVCLAGLAFAAPLAHSGVRPNDRAGMLGVGPQQVADTSDVISRYLASHPAPLRPDDRAGIRGPGLVEDAAMVAPTPSQTSWGGRVLAGTAVVGAILLALLAFAVSRRRGSGAALQS